MPNLQRWLNRDPIEELGGINIYAFVANGPLNLIDLFGLDDDLENPNLGNGTALASYIPDKETKQQTDAIDDCGWKKLKNGAKAAAKEAGEQLVLMAATEGLGNLVKAANAEKNLILGADTVIEEAGVLKTAGKGASLVFSDEKQVLVDMAKADKRAGMTQADMEAYKQLNRELPDPFPVNKVRGPETHPSRSPHSQEPHGHVGPVHHIPITDAN